MHIQQQHSKAFIFCRYLTPTEDLKYTQACLLKEKWAKSVFIPSYDANPDASPMLQGGHWIGMATHGQVLCSNCSTNALLQRVSYLVGIIKNTAMRHLHTPPTMLMPAAQCRQLLYDFFKSEVQLRIILISLYSWKLTACQWHQPATVSAAFFCKQKWFYFQQWDYHHELGYTHPQYNLRSGWLFAIVSMINFANYPIHTSFEHFCTSHSSLLVKMGGETECLI